MKSSMSAWFIGLIVVLAAPGAVAQSAGEAASSGAPAIEAGGAAAEPEGAAGLGGDESGGEASGGGAGEPPRPVPITRKYDLLENDARACSFGATGSNGAAVRWWLVAAGLSAALRRRWRLP